MIDAAELLIRNARMVDTCRTAGEYAQAADEGIDTPGNAARMHWDAYSLVKDYRERLEAIENGLLMAAKRFDRGQREEDATGREYRGGSAA